ncbi:MAG: flagellar hook-length control protein FliK [Chromatiaceae bacterium]
MKIPLTLQPLLDAVGRPSPTLVEQLRVGQTLPAKVLEQVQPGLLRLQLASAVLLARSQVALEPGMRLNLEVTKPFPVPELKILRPLTLQQLRDQVVRAALPRQRPPAEARIELSALRQGHPAPGRAGPDNPLQRLGQITGAQGVRVDRLSGPEIQRAVSHSGLFHEARLAAGIQPPAGDTKLQLLQLLGQLRAEQTDPKGRLGGPAGDAEQATGPLRGGIADGLLARLLRLIEGSLARVQLQQASALPQDDTQRQAWQLDLPLHFGEETQDAFLRIAREAGTGGQDVDPTWAVSLSFSFDTIGTLQCRIALAGDRLSATFWCEQPATLGAIERRLPSLQEAFEAQGFEVVHLAGLVGEPSEPMVQVPIPDKLLDERA